MMKLRDLENVLFRRHEIGKEIIMKDKLMKCLFSLLAIFTLFACSVDAAPVTLTDEYAADKARLSWVVQGTDGRMYNLYIIGENEKFMGGRNAIWKYSDNDQAFGTWSGYHAYISMPGEINTILQSANLFGDSARNDGYFVVNLTNPSWQGGAFIIKGVNGQPDILVTAKQMHASFVDYRFFVIKNGILRPMKFVDKRQQTTIEITGDHDLPYAVDDGTLAVPWFYRGKGTYVSVYMPDFENLMFISAYTYKDKGVGEF